MGLHDGVPSAADMARQFDLPVLAVVQAGRMAQSFGALLHGLRHYRSAGQKPLRWAGVLANGVASDSHARLLRDSLEEPPHWLGQVPRQQALQLPERHLGLVSADELGRSAALATLDAAADVLAATPLGQLGLADWQARWATPFAAAPTEAAPPLLAGRTVAVARDAAFAFIYPANLQALQTLGAHVRFFSPLAGDALPPCDAVWLPGGYPELHAPALAARQDLRAQLQAHADAGRPIWAECGGMMALREALHPLQGAAVPMWSLLPGSVHMRPRLAGLGMQSLTLPTGHTLRGHAFHYSDCQSPLPPLAHTQPAPGSARAAGEPLWVGGPAGNVRASYFHAWFASHWQATAALFLPGDWRHRVPPCTLPAAN